MKYGRNAPCWCQSGKKYKHCHLGRENQAPVPWWETEQEIQAAFQVKNCSVPEEWHNDCARKIVRAHTVPKSTSLLLIARGGHVYSFRPSFENLQKNGGVLEPQLIGLNRASTFTGFCSNHDDRIFAPVEKRPFSGSPEQCFLLGYRAISREVYTKKAQASLVDIYRSTDRGRPREHQIAIQSVLGLYEAGVDAGTKDSSAHKSLYDTALVHRNFGLVRAYIVQLEQPPDVMCSGGAYPEHDFDGRRLQDIADLKRVPHLLTCASFASDRRGYVVFTWLEDSDETCVQFIESLDRALGDHPSDALVRYFFEHCENVHLKPDWWERLPDNERATLVRRMSMSGNPFAPQKSDALVDDGTRLPKWNVVSRQHLGF